MSIRSKGHKRYRMQKLAQDVYVLDLNDMIDDHVVSFDLESQLVSGTVSPGRCPLEVNPTGPSAPSTCSLSKDQIHYLKISLKDYPELIKEMNI